MITKEETNKEFIVYGENGQPFHDIVLKKTTYESVVMSLGDKISGDFLYKDNKLSFTMREYIIYNGVKFMLVNPPTIVREGMVADNSELKGMTKYSVEFYHPMVVLNNFDFSDVAVSFDEETYKSQDKTFPWIGYIKDFADKLNKNLVGSEWVVILSDSITQDKLETMSELLSFDNNTIGDALKTAYDTWEVPFVIDTLEEGEYYYMDSNNNQVDYYEEGKRFVILFGLPSNEIYASEDDKQQENPFVFKFGQGVGLKNNSRTPRNNKIITRIAGYGSEDNIPYGYPQIEWLGDENAQFTIGDSVGVKENVTINGKFFEKAFSYPIYDGILGGRKVRLIKHPFTRTHLMPSIFSSTVNKKVNPFAEDYDPDAEIIEYYDATSEEHYPNPINLSSPSYETHQFEKIKPRLGEVELDAVLPYDTILDEYISSSDFIAFVNAEIARCNDGLTERYLRQMLDAFNAGHDAQGGGRGSAQYTYDWELKFDDYFCDAYYGSFVTQFNKKVLIAQQEPPIDWDDSIDDDGNYNQSYFRVTLPILSFDLYASAAITQEMQVNMRSGACLGCTFTVQVDWDDYRANFYTSDGKFEPEGEQRDYTKYPDSSQEKITIILQKDTQTFGTIMPNIYQQPKSGDKFVILGISLPTSYISNAERELDEASKEYMLENNVYYFDYPLKFDEHFLVTHLYILRQIRNNTIIRFEYGSERTALYVKQMSVKYGSSVLPQFDITLTDDVEIVLNKVGQVTEGVSRMRVDVEQLRNYYNKEIVEQVMQKLSKTEDDVALGKIKFANNVEFMQDIVLHSVIQSNDYLSGFSGSGFKIWKDINGQWCGEIDELTVRGTMNVYEMVINKIRSVGGQILVSKANAKIKNVTTNAEDPNYYEITFEDANPFVVNDLIKCQTFTGTGVKEYWVKVHHISDGIVYIDKNSEDWTGGVPTVGDEVVLCGNTTDTTRQAAILISSSQESSGEPIISVLSGVNSRSFANCLRTRLGYLGDINDAALGQLRGYGLYGDNVYLRGTFMLWNGNTYVEVGKSITAAVNNLEVGGRNLLLNSDFSNENFKLYYGWNNLETGAEHITSDLPQGFSSGAQFVSQGYGYGIFSSQGSLQPCYPLEAGKRYTLSFYGKVTSAGASGNNFYFGLETKAQEEIELTSSWQRYSITFTPDSTGINSSLVFYAMTTGTFYITGLKLERGDKATDWTPSTEDTEAKIEVLSDKIELSVTKNELKSAGITIDGENSKISLNAKTTEVSDDLVVKRVLTNSSSSGVVASMENGIIKAEFGDQKAMFGINDNGQLVLQFWQNNQIVCDLSPDGLLSRFTEVQESWTELKRFISLGNAATPSDWIIYTKTRTGTKYYRYNAGFKQIQNEKYYYNPQTRKYDLREPPTQNGKLFSSKSTTGTLIADGWYRIENLNGAYPAEGYPDKEGVLHVYFFEIFKFENGKQVDNAYVWFRKDFAIEPDTGRLTTITGERLWNAYSYPYLYSYYNTIRTDKYDRPIEEGPQE